MALIGIDSWQPFPDATGYSVNNTELRVWYGRPFLDSDGVSVQSGNGTTGFYVASPVTVASDLSIASFSLRSTLDAIDPAPQSIQCFARLFSNNAPKAWIFAGNNTPNGWVIPNPTPLTTMTYEQLAIYNQTTVLANPPFDTWSASQIQAYFDSLSPASDASDITKGITELSVAPINALIPIAVGDNDTRVPPSIVINAAQVSGANAAVKINNAIALLPSTGGIIDARGLMDLPAVSTTITVNKNGVVLLFGSGVFTSTANPVISVTGNFVSIIGNGKYATQLFVNSATNNGIVVSGPISGFNLLSLALLCHSNADTRTSGTGVTLNMVGDWVLEHLIISDPWEGIALNAAASGVANDVNINGTLAAQSIDIGVIFEGNSIGNTFQDVAVSSTKYYSTGFLIGSDTDTAIFYHCGVQGGDTNGADYGFRIYNNGGPTPRIIKLVNCLVEPNRTTGIGVQIEQADDVEITNMTSTWGLVGLSTTTGVVQGVQVIGGVFGLAQRYGIELDAGSNILLNGVLTTQNSQEADNTYEGIVSAATGVQIVNCRSGSGILDNLINGSAHPTWVQKSGLLVGGGNRYLITGNDFTGNTTSGMSYGGGSNRIIRDNIAFVTRNNGTSAVANGTTSIAVTHGLSMTPTVQDITITPTNVSTNNVRYYVSAVSSTSFTLSVSGDPGVSGFSFGWSAEIL